ncbi:MAG: nucleotide pyrophosphohydrolase [Candidatus Lokiarchaeota archaeon]|nr:nucleotide pyrophosphohydrolase [Candidatus Lokiarchaeota archaeon]
MEIRAFQYLMKDLYFNKDKKRGINGTLLWFYEEIGEFSEAMRHYLLGEKTEDDNISKTEVKEEIADIIAWLCSIANLLGIDVEKALDEKYPDKCRKCGKNPCECQKL